MREKGDRNDGSYASRPANPLSPVWVSGEALGANQTAERRNLVCAQCRAPGAQTGGNVNSKNRVFRAKRGHAVGAATGCPQMGTAQAAPRVDARDSVPAPLDLRHPQSARAGHKCGQPAAVVRWCGWVVWRAFATRSWPLGTQCGLLRRSLRSGLARWIVACHGPARKGGAAQLQRLDLLSSPATVG